MLHDHPVTIPSANNAVVATENARYKQGIADLSLSSSESFHYSHDKDSRVIVVAASYASQKFNFSGVKLFLWGSHGRGKK